MVDAELVTGECALRERERVQAAKHALGLSIHVSEILSQWSINSY